VSEDLDMEMISKHVQVIVPVQLCPVLPLASAADIRVDAGTLGYVMSAGNTFHSLELFLRGHFTFFSCARPSQLRR